MSVQLKSTLAIPIILAVFLSVLYYCYIYYVPNSFERIVAFRVIEFPALVISIFVSLNSGNLYAQMLGLIIGLFITFFIYIYCFCWVPYSIYWMVINFLNRPSDKPPGSR